MAVENSARHEIMFRPLGQSAMQESQATNSTVVASRAHPRAPLAQAATLFALGIWLAGHLDRPASLWAWCTLLLTLCSVAALLQRRARLAQVSAMLALLLAGALARVEAPTTRAPIPSQEFLKDQPVEITGHIINDGVMTPGTGSRERFDVQTETLRLGDHEVPEVVGIRATAFERDFGGESDQTDPAQPAAELLPPRFPQLEYGDRVHFVARLRLPRNFRNPGAFDYESYLHRLGISVQASVRVEDVESLPGKSGSRWGFVRSRIRRSMLERMAGLWTRDDASLFAAMVLGNDSLVERGVRDEFQKTGVYHLLVVSGMNVALLAFALFWLARQFRAPDWAATILTISLSVFYAYIAGMGVPIQRAVLMLSVFLVARLLYRERAPLNATGFAALAVLVWSPKALFDAGFQLTFLALLAISGIALPILDRTSQPFRRALRYFESTSYDLSLQPHLAQLRLDLRLIASRLKIFIGVAPARWLVAGVSRLILAAYELTVVSATTQMVLVLPMRAYFHRAAIIGLPANAAVLPLAGVMLNSAVTAIALSYIWNLPARLAAWIASRALHWVLVSVTWLSYFHVSQWRVPDPGWMVALSSALGIIVALVSVRRREKLAVVLGVVALFISAMIAAFAVSPARLEPGKLEITAIDVGQGDSLLIVSPQGRTMLVDSGGNLGPARGEFDFGEDVVSPYLWSRGLEQLDVVVLSHAHGDHIGGLARIVENFRPRELWVGINPETAALDHLYAVCATNKVGIRRHVAGDDIEWAGTRIRVLSPPSNWKPKSRPMNDDSLAFVISFGENRALLAGDLERKMERFIAAESPSADLLKIAHHGSATSTTPELLAAVKPHFAVISVGAHNSFGHPRLAVLERLQQAHVLTYRTDFLGAVTFLLDGKNLNASVHDSR